MLRDCPTLQTITYHISPSAPDQMTLEIARYYIKFVNLINSIQKPYAKIEMKHDDRTILNISENQAIWMPGYNWIYIDSRNSLLKSKN